MTVRSRADDVIQRTGDVLRPATALYLDVHSHPELSGSERRTAGLLAGWLREAGYQVTAGVGGHGVVGLLANGEGPLVMLRAELDALPIEEKTGLPYASTVVAPSADGVPQPVMHACGHDLHLAAAAGAARLLACTRESWRGTLMVVGQPSEETLTGARAMIDDGLHDRFGSPEVVLAQHLAPMPAGMVAHSPGTMMAASLSLRVVIHGRGGHVATPQQTVDPVVTAAATVLRLQAVVSREMSPAEQVVVSVGSLHAGTQGNVVPDRATMDVTVRALSDSALERAAQAVRRIVAGEAAASGCPSPPEVSELSRSPALIPDPTATEVVRGAHRALFGEQRVTAWPPSMATEDVSVFSDPSAGTAAPHPRVPLVYWMLGSVGRREWAAAAGGSAAEKLIGLPPTHSPYFAPSVAPTLSTGISAMLVAALTQLRGP